MKHIDSLIKSERIERKERRRGERKRLRMIVFDYFCLGGDISDALRKNATDVDIFAGWDPMTKEDAFAFIADCATLSRKEQKASWPLFQAWFIVGNKSYWNVVDNFKNERKMLENARSKFKASSAAYHVVIKRQRTGSTVHYSCPRCIPCSHC